MGVFRSSGLIVGHGKVLANEAEDTDDNTVVELDQDRTRDVRNVNGGDAGDVPAVGVNEDTGDVMDPEVAQFVDEHIMNDGFLSRRKWPSYYTPCVRPGDGYWLDDDGDGPLIQAFIASTADGLETAQQRRMPDFIWGNRFRLTRPKRLYDKQEDMYRLCKKIAVSPDGKIFRATNEEILDALEACELHSLGMSAEFYVKAVAEARRRHLISRQTDEAAKAQKEQKNSAQPQRRQHGQVEEEATESDGEAARRKKRSRVRFAC